MPHPYTQLDRIKVPHREPVMLLLVSALRFCVLPVVFLLAAATLLCAQGPMLLVANQEDRTVSLIDPASGHQTTVAVSGVTGHEVAVYPAGHLAFVPIYGDSGVGKPGTSGRFIDVIDLTTVKRIASIDFGHGVRPHCAVFDPLSGLLYVTSEVDESVSVIDPKTLKIVGEIPTAQAQSHMLVISHDGRRGYTANVGPGTVSVLDLKARKTITVIPVAGEIQRISISADDTMVFTADQLIPRLAVIDTHANKLKAWIDLPAVAYGTASTRDGRWLLVTLPSQNKVAVIDLQTLAVTRIIDVGAHPVEVLVRPDGMVAYVSCIEAHEVTAIDLKQWTVQKFLQAGGSADGLAWWPGP